MEIILNQLPFRVCESKPSLLSTKQMRSYYFEEDLFMFNTITSFKMLFSCLTVVAEMPAFLNFASTPLTENHRFAVQQKIARTRSRSNSSQAW